MVNFECEKLLVRESVISKNLVLSSCILYSGWLCDPNKLFSVEQNKKKCVSSRPMAKNISQKYNITLTEKKKQDNR